MRTATLRTGRSPSRRAGPVARTAELPAPVGGLNARDSITNMPATDAVRLTNYWCTTTEVNLRDGYSNHATGLSGAVNSLMVYNKVGGTSEMFAANGAFIYNVTSAGAIGAAVVSGLTSDKWQWIQFSTTGGNYLYAVNGADKPLLYDGTTWTPIDGLSTPAITGVTTTDLVNINVFKTRIWFVQKNSLISWYLPTSAVGGAAASFDFRPIFKKGGYLVAMATWSIDGGSGLDDYAVFVTSQGEVAVYQGTDPASASTFALKGVYQVGNPIGYRCFDKFAGDVILINRDGIVPLSRALISSQTNARAALTDKINQAISVLAKDYASTFGWQTQLYPQENMLILNVPVTGNVRQFAMNTITGAWSMFTGWNANCFARMGETVYFGGTSVVSKIWDVATDNAATITGEALQAFSKFGSPTNKHFKMARPIFYTNGSPSVSLNINVNYQSESTFSAASVASTTFGVWDTGLWDDALWGGDGELNQNWQSPGAIGYTGALAIKVMALGAEFRWQATQFVFENGDVL